MNAKTLIRKTRDGEPLSAEEIEYLVRGAASGEIPPYQLTAWMMAVYFRGLSRPETAALTQAVIRSGRRIPMPATTYPPADKHSTGGVGDKLSFLVAPLVAAAGVPVPMISGRSLGHTGGTLDKLESIPGLETTLTPEEFILTVEEVGLCIAGQSAEIAPADRVLYSLRDAASIVESIPLITASILGKKAAAGVRALALDVKTGTGAFMTDRDDARRLAESLVATAGLLGIRARAHSTRMDRVLGRTAGNALEVAESVRALRSEGVAPDLRELTLALAGTMLELAGAAVSTAEAERTIDRIWASGAGYERFARMVAAQEGDVSCLEDLSRLPHADSVLEVTAPLDGFFLGVSARPAGEWITEAGGGRLVASDVVDPRVGLEILAPAGERVSASTPVLRLHLPPAGAAPDLAERARGWIVIGNEPETPSTLLLETIDSALE